MEGRLGLVSLEVGEMTWLDLSPQSPDAEGASKYAGRLSSANFLGWNRDGTKGLVTALSYDFKDRWIQVLDAESRELTVVAHDHDEAWLAGPCLDPCAGWMPAGDRIYLTGERDGYNHLYTVGADGNGLQQLTSGEWEINRVEIAPDERSFYLTTNEGSPFEQHFYHMRLDGSRRTRDRKSTRLNSSHVAISYAVF